MNNLPEELWQTIPNYTLYEAHPEGYVRNKKTRRIMQSECKKHRYISLFLNNNKMVSLHRLIALTFLSNPNNLPQVNHKDGNKRNNTLSNLEWISPSDNIKHSVSMGRKKSYNKSIPIRVTMKDNTTQTFNSFTEAAKHLQVNIGAIQHCLKTDGIYCGIVGLKDTTDDKWLWKVEKIENEVRFENCIIKEVTVEGFTHLMACSDGTIHNKTTKRIVGSSSDGRYIRVHSSILNGKNSSKTAHRLIALTFLPNPENKPCVNHIDGNTKNNSVSNLEWCTQQENMIHAIATGLINTETKSSSIMKHQEPVHLLELNGTILKTFESLIQLSEYLNCNRSSISVVCQQKKNNTIMGFGCCLVRKYKKQYNKSFLQLFPELENRDDIHYDLLRDYIIRVARPIFQVDFDGTLIKRWESQIDAANDMELSSSNINSCCTKYGKHLCKGYFWRYASYEEILNTSYQKEIPSIVRNALKIPPNTEVNIKPDIVNLLRENINEKGHLVIKTKPIVQMTLEGEFIKYWSGPTVARKQLGIGRYQIEQVLHGICTTSNGYKWRFLTLEEMII